MKTALLLCLFSLMASFAHNGSETTTLERGCPSFEGHPGMPAINEDYDLILLPQLISFSDLAVTATVQEVKEHTLLADLDSAIVGTPEATRLIIQKYIPSKFDGPREVPYAKGQSFLFFLKQMKAQNTEEQKWRVSGVAGEGELPLQDNSVYFIRYYIEGLDKGDNKVHGMLRRLDRYPLPEFMVAVSEYGKCFTWESVVDADGRRRYYARVVCTTEDLQVYRERSWMANYLAQESLKRIRKSDYSKD